MRQKPESALICFLPRNWTLLISLVEGRPAHFCYRAILSEVRPLTDSGCVQGPGQMNSIECDPPIRFGVRISFLVIDADSGKSRCVDLYPAGGVGIWRSPEGWTLNQWEKVQESGLGNPFGFREGDEDEKTRQRILGRADLGETRRPAFGICRRRMPNNLRRNANGTITTRLERLSPGWLGSGGGCLQAIRCDFY